MMEASRSALDLSPGHAPLGKTQRPALFGSAGGCNDWKRKI